MTLAETSQSTNWRGLLLEIIRDAKKRQNMASIMGINPATLTRWATNETNPRIDELRSLLIAAPELRNSLLHDLLSGNVDELPALPSLEASALSSEEPSLLPPTLYTSVLKATRNATPRFGTVCKLVLPQILRQLDPKQSGMEVTIAICMPPRADEPVRSLRERLGQGTAPWTNGYQEEKNCFLGTESLAGYAVMQRHWIAVPNVHDQIIFPLKPSSYEASAAAFPIVQESKLAGCLIVLSTQTDFFSDGQIALLNAFADLSRLAFTDAEFYPAEKIQLAIMPPWETQKAYFPTLRQRITEIQQLAQRSQNAMDIHEADYLARKELEEKLLQSR